MSFFKIKMKLLFFLIISIFLKTISSQCTEVCVCDNYVHNETTNPGGVNTCTDEDSCQCNGTRMCSSSGWCNACQSLIECPAIITSCATGTYQSGSSCDLCSYQCYSCTGSSSCTECNSNYYLNDGYCGCLGGTYDNGSSCVSTSCQTDYYYYNGQVKNFLFYKNFKIYHNFWVFDSLPIISFLIRKSIYSHLCKFVCHHRILWLK